MSRKVGPYKDVATARVEGAYELCEGVDETGRPVQILTLGSSSSKDPARRGLLSDTVAWAYATATSEDSPILGADLEGEQPYVVVLRDTRLRGADRIMDRLLSLGPATGPLPVGAAAAASRPQAPSSPAGPPTAPPTSPQVVIAAPKRPSQARPILIGVASIVAIVALVLSFWLLWSRLSDGESDAAPAPDGSASSQELAEVDPESAEEGAAEEGPDEATVPEWRSGTEELSVAGEHFDDQDATREMAVEGWPFAFRVPEDFQCDPDRQTTTCSAGDDGASTVEVSWEVCQDGCSEAAHDSLRRELPYQPMQEYENGDVGFSVREPFGQWKASMSVFVESEDTVLHVSAVADVARDLTDQVQPILNDVLNQARALQE